ncbi:MAG TPA: T9SS type A sorting domain-containing protein, partial [Bacteroidia bacterium]|nr:T9SS type A sorting domain-containing protein [Bacteroidia bacterium]
LSYCRDIVVFANHFPTGIVPDTINRVCAVETNDSLPPGPTCEIDDCKNTVTALVLVTPEAIEEALGFNPDPVYATLYFTLGEQTINYALINSSVVGKSFRFVTEVYEGFDFDPGNSLPALVADLVTLSTDTEALDELADSHADLLVLITDSRYNSYFGIQSGQFAIVTSGHMFFPDWTFAHEIGHALDAQHSREYQGGDIDDDLSGCNTGYKATIPGLGYLFTVMAVIDEGESRIPYFSNPNIYFSGIPIGNSKSYNAGYITGTICEVADYDEQDELEISISGPMPVCNQASNYSVSISAPGTGVPGTGPYTYKWYLGAQPYTNPLAGSLKGNSSSVNITPTLTFPEKYRLYASVHSSDGVMANVLRKFDNPCMEAEEKSQPALADVFSSNYFICRPNPALDHLNIVFSPTLREYDTYPYRILNRIGQVEKSGQLDATNSDSSRQVDIDLTTGLYFLQVQYGSIVVTQKFIVNH